MHVNKQGAFPDVVELTIPATGDLVALARFTAATLAAKANFDVEEIEDLRLAVDELCVMMIREDVDGGLELHFSCDGEVLEISCGYVDPLGQDGAPVPADSLSERIIDALVDEHGSSHEGGRARAWLRKRRLTQRG